MARTTCLLALALALLASSTDAARLLKGQAQATSSASASGHGASWASASASSTDSVPSTGPMASLLGQALPAQPAAMASQPAASAPTPRLALPSPFPPAAAGFPSTPFPMSAFPSSTPSTMPTFPTGSSLVAQPQAQPFPFTATAPSGGMPTAAVDGVPTGSTAQPSGGATAGVGATTANSNGAGGCPDVQATLDAHNSARSAVGVPPLSWSDSLASYAAGVSTTCRMAHSGGPYGENLYASSSASTCKAAVDAWMTEASSRGLHYTQIVYPATSQVGCAIASCGMVTCSYDVIQGSRGM